MWVGEERGGERRGYGGRGGWGELVVSWWCVDGCVDEYTVGGMAGWGNGGGWEGLLEGGGWIGEIGGEVFFYQLVHRLIRLSSVV